MRPQDDIDYTTLAWVKGELDETLKQAQQALEAYVEDPSDVSQMRFCATYLHQVQGTLRMIELYGAALVTEEMEYLARALLDDQVAERDEAYTALMRGIVQIPDYLERIQVGHKDIPVVLLPLLNDLRAARGEKGLSEISLFMPSLGQELPGAARGPAQPLPEDEMRLRAEPLRNQFQLALLKWFRGEDIDGNLTRLTQTLDALIALTHEIEARRLFWVAAGVLEALHAKAFEASPQLKQTIGKVEREIKRLVDVGEKSFRADAPRELTRNLLYFVAHAPTEYSRIGEMRDVFNLAALLPSQEEIESARSSLTGHNRSLLDTVSNAIKDDLMRVKDALDLNLRNPDSPAANLEPQVEVLDRVADTLGMLGLNVARRVVQEQRDAVRDTVDGKRPGDESHLLEIAGALLYVESSLDDQVQHLGIAPNLPAGERLTEQLPSIEARRVMQALVKEAQANFTRAKHCFVGFIESSWDAAQLADAPELLDQVAGALRIVELPEPASYLDAVARFTERELIDQRRVPSVAQMETLADALVSLEYFLEAQAELRPGRERILDTARSSLERLGYWPIPATHLEGLLAAGQAAAQADESPSLEVPETAQSAEPQPEIAESNLAAPETASADSAAVEPLQFPEIVPEPAPVIGSEPLAPVATSLPEIPLAADGVLYGGFEATDEEIDADIREVFIEEVGEEIENLGQLMPAWVAEPTQMEQLKSIRRVFHTLKGSGRLVGAKTLGEFSWKVENMLNRVLDQTIQPSANVVHLVQSACDVLPEILCALRGERAVQTALEPIKDVADRLAAGEQVRYVAPEPSAAAPESPALELPEADQAAPLDVQPVEVESIAPAELQAEADADTPEAEALPEAAFEPEPEAEAFSIQSPDVEAPAPEAVDTPEIEAEAASPAEASDKIKVKAIEPVLLDILKPEVSSHLGIIEDWLAHAPQPVSDALVRAIHTMNGAFAMIEVPVVTDITAPLETCLKRAQANALPLSVEGLAVLGESVHALRRAVEELEQPEPALTPLDALAARICAERDRLPEVQAGLGLSSFPFEGEEIPELTSAVSMPVEGELDEAATANLVQDMTSSLDSIPTGAVESFDPQALSSLSEQDMPIEGVALEGLVDADELERALQFDGSAEDSVSPIFQGADDSDGAAAPSAETHDDSFTPALPEAESERVDEAESAETASAANVFDWPDEEAEASLETPAMQELLSEAKKAALQADEDTAPSFETEAEAELPSALETQANIDSAPAASEDAPEAPTAEPAEVVEDMPALQSESDWVDMAAFDMGLDSEDGEDADFASIPMLDGSTDDASPGDVDALIQNWLQDQAAGSDIDTPIHAPEPAVAEAETQPEAEASEDAEAGIEAAETAQTPEAEAESPAPEAEAEAPTEAERADESEAAAEAASEALPSIESVTAALVASSTAVALAGDEADPDQALELPDMDDELLDSFVEEASDILDRADELMTNLRQNPQRQDTVVALQRDLHTLKGGARVSGLDGIGELSHAMESLLEIVAAGQQSLSPEGVNLLEAAFDRLNRMKNRVANRRAVAMPLRLVDQLERLARGEALLPDPAPEAAPAAATPEASAATDTPTPQEPFVAGAEADLLAATPAAPGLEAADPDPDMPLALPDMDEELLDIFAEEAGDVLEHAERYMVRLREKPGDPEIVMALQRDLHTLKGGARMAGLFPIGDLGHVMEGLLENVTQGHSRLPPMGLDILELGFERLGRMVSRVASRRAIVTPVQLIQRVEMLSRGESVDLGLDAAQAAPQVPSATPLPPVSAPVPTQLSEPAKDDSTLRAPQEQIRIRADLLDQLVNYAGEVAIYRARLEQQLGLFRGNLAELEQTTERLRGQLRKLEIETEAQIASRYQREHEVGGKENFDPLELDRFSTLQQLSRALTESAADLTSLQASLEDHTRQYESLLLQQSRVSSDLQEGLMRTRMVPFESLVPRMRRIVRQTAAELGKKAALRVEGAQGEMDRGVLEHMIAPLEHMLRNSLAHGLELPDGRSAAGKAEEGAITIGVSREGSEVVIKVSDDGRGLDRDAIRRKAVERGLLAADATISDRELYNFVLASGFSTVSQVSKVAGRGVGMDVVNNEIRQLGGSLSIESTPGQGSTFTIRLPFTLAVTQAVFVQQGETSYAVPIASVQGVARIDRTELEAQLGMEKPSFVYAGEEYEIHDLGRLLGQPVTRAEGSLQVPLLLARSGDLRTAICVDNVIGSREAVVKPVGPQVSSIPGIFGATIMGDGRVIMLLDVAPLVRRHLSRRDAEVPEVPAVVEPARHVPLVMVVDDSITMRKVTGRVLERAGYEVLTAKDGVDAIEKLVDRVPDVMLLDIEMPRMDGYELATHIRNDVRLRGIPIIMITSRSGEKHRQRAFEIGVDRYLGKPYQEAELMRNVEEILKVDRGNLG